MVTIGMTKRVGKPWLFLRRTTVDGSWSTEDGICADGQFKRMDDPNILVLKRENGEEFGTVHVAYMSRRREQGQLYLFRNSKVTRFYLVSTKPAFTVESGDVDPAS
mgnify:CR=1 FL=1